MILSFLFNFCFCFLFVFHRQVSFNLQMSNVRFCPENNQNSNDGKNMKSVYLLVFIIPTFFTISLTFVIILLYGPVNVYKMYILRQKKTV